jgi:hypothetical protein
MIVCRLVEDTENPGLKGVEDTCSECGLPVYVESGIENEPDERVCLRCCVKNHPNSVLFAERPPDEYGRSSISVTAEQVLANQNGEWHKNGVWHDQKWVLKNLEG